MAFCSYVCIVTPPGYFVKHFFKYFLHNFQGAKLSIFAGDQARHNNIYFYAKRPPQAPQGHVQGRKKHSGPLPHFTGPGSVGQRGASRSRVKFAQFRGAKFVQNISRKTLDNITR